MSDVIDIWFRFFHRFIVIMFRAHHTTSWTEGTWSDRGENGRCFLFFTVDDDVAAKAKAALDHAGVLCNVVLDGPQSYTSKPRRRAREATR